jgi:hypothetical protein
MAYEFNGTSQYLNVGSAPVSGAPLTLACWFNSDSATTNQTILGISADIVGIGNVSNWFRIRLAGAVAGDPVQAEAAVSPTFAGASSSVGYTTGSWHHACGVFSNNASRTIYLDGANSSTNTTSVSPTGLNGIQIGAIYHEDLNSIVNYTDGRIAEVGIWNAALTAAEVASLAKGMTCDKVRPQSLVFYAPLVRDLIDAKGGLTITNNNGATVANHPRVYA